MSVKQGTIHNSRGGTLTGPISQTEIKGKFWCRGNRMEGEDKTERSPRIKVDHESKPRIIKN